MGREERPGVKVTRRRMLAGSTLALTALGLSSAARATRSRRRGTPFEDFVGGWRELLDALLEDAEGDEDRYLFELCALLRDLSVDSVPRREKPGYQRAGVQSAGVFGQDELMVVELELEPGAVIQAHNHVGYCFATLGRAGSCRVRHFERVDAVAPVAEGRSPSFRVQETRSSVLLPGRISHLSRTRDNIHWFRAGAEGATILDFGTTFGDPGGGFTTFSALEIQAEPVNAEERWFEACWIGNPFR